MAVSFSPVLSVLGWPCVVDRTFTSSYYYYYYYSPVIIQMVFCSWPKTAVLLLFLLCPLPHWAACDCVHQTFSPLLFCVLCVIRLSL